MHLSRGQRQHGHGEAKVQLFHLPIVWGEPIAKAARNYESEALWVTVHGYYRNEYLDVS